MDTTAGKRGMKRFMLIICGLIGALFTVLHAMFWQILHWKDELARLSAINRGVMQVLNVAFLFILLFSTIATFFLARRSDFDRGEKMFLGLFGSFYLWRAFLEIPFFGWSGRGTIIIAFCLVSAFGYLLNYFEKAPRWATA